MTPETIQQAVDYIRAVQDDPEEAHNAEDHLYVSVLSAIAEGLLDDPAKCARLALSAGDIRFPRWCA